MNWDSDEIRSIIQNALREDLGSGDITTNTLIPETRTCSAAIVAKQDGVVAGLPLVSRVFRMLDSGVEVEEQLSDGDAFSKEQPLCRIAGPATSILSGERVVLNFLQRLSGIATQTAEYVRLAQPHGIKVLDTRKTTPLLRVLEKYAVHVGGGTNHRMGLYDGVMVKDNHLKVEPNFRAILKRFQELGFAADIVEIEVASPEMLKTAADSGVKWFLLDNMTPDQIRECVRWKKEGMMYEISGGISMSNFREYLISGIDSISVGGLTHSVRSIDLSMEIL